MTPTPARKGITRRRALTGAAWAAPAVAATATVPAYAASVEPLTVDYGVFTQAFNTAAENKGRGTTFFGLDSYRGQTDRPNARLRSETGLTSDGGGTFTPGGSVGNGLYGGAGLWFAAPHTASGEYTGVTTLAAGARFTLTYVFTFPETNQVRPPKLWDAGGDISVPALPSSAGGSKTNNPRLKAFNGAGFTAVWGQLITRGEVLTGTLTITTDEDMVASSGDGMQVLNQLLFSQVPVYYTEVGASFELTTTLTVTSGSLKVAPADGAPGTEVNITGLTATATVTG